MTTVTLARTGDKVCSSHGLHQVKSLTAFCADASGWVRNTPIVRHDLIVAHRLQLWPLEGARPPDRCNNAFLTLF